MMLELETFVCEQNTYEWACHRMGWPTASRFSDVMAAGQGKSRYKYMCQLAGEQAHGVPAETWRNASMDRGHAMEPELRSQYALLTNADLTLVGFVRRKIAVGYIGCSPDALIGEDGALEIKSMRPELLIQLREAGRVPSEHMAQIQGIMLVTGRKWCDVMIGYTDVAPGYPGVSAFRRRVMRDEAAISRLWLGLDTFNRELKELAARHGVKDAETVAV